METHLFVRVQELHDQGVTEVMLFPLYPQHAMASTTTILELAEDQKKYFPEMKFTIVPAFIINQTIYKTLLILKEDLEGYDDDHLCFLTTEFQSVTSAKQTLRNHIVKLMDLAVIHRRQHMSFATVISVTKRQSRLSNY
jgi:hypothetical protein